MKIICTVGNYAARNKARPDSFISHEPIVFMKSDASLLNGGKPFFLPDFSSDIQYGAEVVVRIHRLGRHIARRFAPRYYGEITVGVDFTACDLQRRFQAQGLPWDLCKSFDGSAVIGQWFRLENLPYGMDGVPFHLEVNNKRVQEGNTSEMQFKVDELIEYVSRFHTLKTGDLLYTGTPAGAGAVCVGDRLQGFLGDRKVLDFYVR